MRSVLGFWNRYLRTTCWDFVILWILSALLYCLLFLIQHCSNTPMCHIFLFLHTCRISYEVLENMCMECIQIGSSAYSNTKSMIFVSAKIKITQSLFGNFTLIILQMFLIIFLGVLSISMPIDFYLFFSLIRGMECPSFGFLCIKRGMFILVSQIWYKKKYLKNYKIDWTLI